MSGLYSIDIQASTAMPLFREAEEIERMRETGEWRLTDPDPWLAFVADEAIPEIYRLKRDRAWTMIRPLILDQPAIFQPRLRSRAVQAVMAETGATKQTIYRLLRRYWQRGMTPNALLPDYDRCGGRGKERASSGKKRGRPADRDDLGVNVTPEMRQLFRSVVTKKFAKNAQMDLRVAYDELIASAFSDQAINEQTGRQELVPRKDAPTFRQFCYWSEKDNDLFRVDRIRRTPRVYDKDRRAILGSSTAETVGPASRFQIDATIADVYLVSRYDRAKIVGRPVLYIVIDVFSRMITGVYVGFEGPSWVGAMMALANTATEKVGYCRQFGVEIGEADWPCQALPDALLGDRGEVAGSAVETLINNFQVRVETAAPYRADWKGIVEQRFRLIPARFKAYVAGYVATDFRERGAKDYRLDATLDIDQFTRIILYCILYYNNQHVLKDYEKTPDMIADGVQAIPSELWDWGIAHRSGSLRVFPPELVRLSLLPNAEAMVTATGIRYADCFYTCQKAIEDHWFERARQRGRWKVKISYEPRCMDVIYLHDDLRQGKFISCTLTEKSRHHLGRTLWEIDQIRQEERRAGRNNEQHVQRGRINLIETIKNVMQEAQIMQTNAPNSYSSNRQRTGSIRENRRREKRDNQEREAFQTKRRREDAKIKGEILHFPTGKMEDDYRLPDIAEILRRQNEEQGDDDAG
ncbi:DDE-type integrase/transposase/recombinase [Acidithiobacillus sp. AMEEHan]|uniref:DDE-type integrase/transposase/recombinase n=1 Tax=Acidithiobacillus sp. AMEEHan TaxID=2994951 RepID=UPI0027E481FB|nr:DDE-type integrase/transposase/recombinase [Acidithiobacillus sp. AMEEHan]